MRRGSFFIFLVGADTATVAVICSFHAVASTITTRGSKVKALSIRCFSEERGAAHISLVPIIFHLDEIDVMGDCQCRQSEESERSNELELHNSVVGGLRETTGINTSKEEASTINLGSLRMDLSRGDGLLSYCET